jgi:pimeloyl-[acyl-carrier protein] methyl ester esterase
MLWIGGYTRRDCVETMIHKPGTILTTPTLVFLPGLHGTADLFYRIVRCIPVGFRVRIIGYPIDEPLDYSALLARITPEIEAEGEVVLVAESFAGPLAVAYAAAHPEVVRAVVLGASFVSPPRATWVRHLVARFWFLLPVPEFLIRLFVTGWHADPVVATELMQQVRRNTPAVLALRMREIFQRNSLESLGAIPAPILYLAARHDRIVSTLALDQIVALRGDVVVRTIDASHLLLEASPRACWEEIEAFLIRVGLVGPEV